MIINGHHTTMTRTLISLSRIRRLSAVTTNIIMIRSLATSLSTLTSLSTSLSMMISSKRNISPRDLPEAEVRESLTVKNMIRMSSSVSKDLTLITTSKMKDLNSQEVVEVEAEVSSREQLTTTIAGRMISLSRDKTRGLDAEVEVPNPPDPDASKMSDKETRLYNSLSVVKTSTSFNPSVLILVIDTFSSKKS